MPRLRLRGNSPNPQGESQAGGLVPGQGRQAETQELVFQSERQHMRMKYPSPGAFSGKNPLLYQGVNVLFHSGL